MSYLKRRSQTLSDQAILNALKVEKYAHASLIFVSP